MSTSSNPVVALVTGDVVLDCHLYGGVKTAATSFSEPGTSFTRQLGGAVLTNGLLHAAAVAHANEWDQAKKDWEKTNELLRKARRPELPWPAGLATTRPVHQIHLGLKTEHLESSLPEHLRSYGVWTDRPARKGSKDRVWRVERHFGYGVTARVELDGIFQPDPMAQGHHVDLTVIDDGGILFRQATASKAWPEFGGATPGHHLLKMSWPLCRGDLWTKLTAVGRQILDRLIVIVSASDLRREDARISRRLSWEQCAENTRDVFESDPTARELGQAANVIVTFGSEGALWIRRGTDGQRSRRLLFDPDRQEGDHALDFDGTAYGFQTCLEAGVAHHLMKHHCGAHGTNRPSPFADAGEMDEAIQRGIVSGLMARRRLLELGHGAVGSTPAGFPVCALGEMINKAPGGLVVATVPSSSRADSPWTILAEPEPPASFAGLAQLTARYGTGALSHVPALRLGRLVTVDRGEIESLRTLDALIRAYEATKVQKKPLSIGIFGPPGAGKSFGVKALAEAILGDKVPFLEFNLSQFKNPEELVGAFHRIRDAVLRGITPVAFWDEFDSKSYEWLQYLLAPMQDGAFQEGQITHPIGKCIFIFAGGTSSTLDAFGVAKPKEPTTEELACLSSEDRAELREHSERYREYVLRKGPDFVSRLHGFLNVLGPNPREGANCTDQTWPIRRALMLRGILDLKDAEELNIDPGLLYALLNGPKYKHGARSFEKIVNILAHDRENGRLHRSALPPDPVLTRDTGATELHELMGSRNAFKYPPDLEPLAAAFHKKFLDEAEKSKLEAKLKGKREKEWIIHPAIQQAYDQLDADAKTSNRAAARRIADHLALIDFVVEPQAPNDDGSWTVPLAAAIEMHLELLAQAEHLGWCAERVANGWTYHQDRDNARKRHHLLTDWSKLSPGDQDKDRSIARSIPALLKDAGFKAVPVSTPP